MQMEETKVVEENLKAMLTVMVTRAENEVDALMPGYTHLQRAQPVRWAHLLLSHAQSFLNDLSRLRQLYPRISVLPLGSAALAGNPYNLDRELLRQELDFMSIGENSMHAVADRDFIVEWLQWASLTQIHMSRFAEDMIIYSSAEFGFVTLSDAYRSVSDAAIGGCADVLVLDRPSCPKRRTQTRSNCYVASPVEPLGKWLVS